MTYSYIEEVLDSVLPQNEIDIVHKDIPAKGDILLIEESNIIGQVEYLEGYEGMQMSNIQLYVRLKALQGATVCAREILEQYYTILYNNAGKCLGNYKIESIGAFTISSSMRDKDNNVIQSLDFTIRYIKK